MIAAPIHHNFEQWRSASRALLLQNVPPEQVIWTDTPLLPAMTQQRVEAGGGATPNVPRAFLQLARNVVHFRADEVAGLLYRLLWRLTHGEPRLLDVAVDDDVHRAMQMDTEIRHDVHRMHAFVRFRKVEATDDAGRPTAEQYVAWHRPDHLIVPLASPFFARRFGVMHWTILTPDASATWDGEGLQFGPGVPRSAAPQGDELEELWRTYYGATFNPARVSIKTMKQHLPVRYWATLPEADTIDQLLKEAPRRVEEMVKRQTKTDCPVATSAAEFVPDRLELAVLSEAARTCQGCGIYCNATQTVFGEGPAEATLMFVGEQPGDQEDLAGKPFVGPSGALLNAVMEEVGLPRDETYVTNAVKHFKFEQRGKRRIHSKPSSREVGACRPWLEAEIKTIQPKMIVCLGATAAQSLMGNAFRVTQHRGEVIKDQTWAPWMLATVHPSSLLRMPDPDARAEARAQFAQDIALAAKHLKQLTKSH